MKSVLATAVLLACPVYQTNSTLHILGGLFGKDYGAVKYGYGVPTYTTGYTTGYNTGYNLYNSGYNLQQAAQNTQASTPSQSYTTNNYFSNVNSAQVANQHGGNGGGSQSVNFQASYRPAATGGKGGKGGKVKLSNKFNFNGQVQVNGKKKNAKEFSAQLDNAKAYYNKGNGCNSCIDDALRGKKNVFVNVDKKKSYLVNKKRIGPGDLSVSAPGDQIVQDSTDPAELAKLFVVEEVDDGEFEVQDVSDDLVEDQ